MAAEGLAGAGDAASGVEGLATPGEIIGGKFVVERVLGVGGMGIVVAARHLQLGQTVAIKFLRRSACSPESVNRFLREARAVAGLQSAHVVRIMDVGSLDDGLPYMIMEHLCGTDLGHVLDIRRMLPLEEAVDYLLQAMEAVAEAHAIGLVHRDLKPSNLFLTLRSDGTPLVKVLDFGISKAIDPGPDASLTSTSTVLGSPLYMSPEQVRSTKNVDRRTDIWALGVILYELLAGAPPFEAETVTGLCAKIVADPPTPLRGRRPELPLAIESLVGRCLDKDVKRRPQSVAELAGSLRPFASSDGKQGADRIARIVGGPRASQPNLPASGAASGAQGEINGSEPASPVEYAETVATNQTSGALRRQRRARASAVALIAFAALCVVAITIPLRPTRGPAPATLASGALVSPASARTQPPSSDPAAPPEPTPVASGRESSPRHAPESPVASDRVSAGPEAAAAATVTTPSSSTTPFSHRPWTPPHATAPSRVPLKAVAAANPTSEDLLVERK